MTARLAHIWRHPLKALGREEVAVATLTPGGWLPGDRIWAVAHDRAKLDGGWAVKANFLRGVTEPQLMGVTARYDERAGLLTLDHPAAGRIDFDPDDCGATNRLLAWLSTIWPNHLPGPTGIYRAAGAQLTDSPDPWISVHVLASHRAIEEAAGQPLSIHRWRGNLWLHGPEAWEEFNWLGRRLRIGETELLVRERIMRCKATMANPETGQRDVDTLDILHRWDHQDFGVFAEVLRGGRIRAGDPVEVAG